MIAFSLRRLPLGGGRVMYCKKLLLRRGGKRKTVFLKRNAWNRNIGKGLGGGPRKGAKALVWIVKNKKKKVKVGFDDNEKRLGATSKKGM